VLERNGTEYVLQHRDTERVWRRTIVNVDKWRGCVIEATDPERAKILQNTGHEPDSLQVGDIIATCDEPPDAFYLGKILSIEDEQVAVQFYTTPDQDLDKARFRLTWVTQPET